MKMRSTTSGPVLCGLALLLVFLASPAWAAEETGTETAPAASTVTMPVTVAGMQVSIDPATGRLRQPTPAEARALSAAFQKAFGSNGLARKTVVRKDANGMLTAQVDFSLFDFSVAEILPDGTVATRCVGGPAETPAPAVPEDR
jgi:hypothetical protein